MISGPSDSVTANAPEQLPGIRLANTFCDIARENGLVFDVDSAAVREAVLSGGIQPEDISNCPVIIIPNDDPFRKGVRVRSSAFNNGNPAIEVFSFMGTGAVSTRLLAHEAQHEADRTYLGDDAFLNKKTVADAQVCRCGGRLDSRRRLWMGRRLVWLEGCPCRALACRHRPVGWVYD